MKFGVIYADPPWKFNNKNTGGGMKSGAFNKYAVMDIEKIKSLPIKDLADDDCVLFMWWVASMPQEALDVVKSWGFTIKTMSGFNWIKKTSGGKPFFGMGTWTRAGSELCLIATKGKPTRFSASVRSVNEFKILSHSSKPSEFRRMIDEMVIGVNKIELFSRDKTEGWTYIDGKDECDASGNDIIEEINKLKLL